MYNSLDEYLQEKRDKENALHRKLNLLRYTVKNNDNEEIERALLDLLSTGADLSTTPNNYMLEYLRSTDEVSSLVIMLMLSMKHPLHPATLRYIKGIFFNESGYGNKNLTEEDRGFLSTILAEELRKGRA
ncbi:TPA: hypothetical protein MB364_000828 [Klebsiella variicola subsp. variicola]|nr:hypothetical protein [Klebsiella variicola subsp. variicola]